MRISGTEPSSVILSQTKFPAGTRRCKDVRIRLIFGRIGRDQSDQNSTSRKLPYSTFLQRQSNVRVKRHPNVALTSNGCWEGTFEIVSKEVLWSVRGSYQTLWGPPLPNVTRHSGWWPSTVKPSIDQALHQCLTLLLIWTLLPNLTFYLNAIGFHRTLQRVQHANRRHLLIQTPGPVPLWDLQMF